MVSCNIVIPFDVANIPPQQTASRAESPLRLQFNTLSTSAAKLKHGMMTPMQIVLLPRGGGEAWNAGCHKVFEIPTQTICNALNTCSLKSASCTIVQLELELEPGGEVYAMERNQKSDLHDEEGWWYRPRWNYWSSLGVGVVYSMSLYGRNGIECRRQK